MAVKVTFHTFGMGDVEDPYLYAAFPISEWQQTDHGRWVMEHAVGQPTFYCDADITQFGYRVRIIGELEEPDATYFQLKYGHLHK